MNGCDDDDDEVLVSNSLNATFVCFSIEARIQWNTADCRNKV